MENAEMHSSMSRLLKLSSGIGEEDPGAEAALRSIGERLDVTPAVMTNWKARGISKAGAIAAGATFGCSSNWLLTGDGAPDQRERRTQALDVTEALRVLGEALGRMEDPGARKAAVGMLHDYIDAPSQNDDMVQLIARRLAGEISVNEHSEQRRA